MTKSNPLIPFLLFIVMTTHWVKGQEYGNEWINSSQSYYKFNIAEDGIYRISRTDLLNAGFPVGSVNPSKIQLFHQGTELAIKVSGENDGVFDTNDYIEFYGVKSDGSTDTDLYVTESAQPHTYYNIFSDSSAYFLTFALDLTDGRRLTEFFENNSGNLPAENYFYDSPLSVFATQYFEGQSYGANNDVIQGTYDLSEGWTGDFATRGQSIDHTIIGLDHWLDDSTTPLLELLLTGGNNLDHNVDIFVGPSSASTRLIHTAEFTGDESYTVSENLQWTDISGGGELFIRATVNGVGGEADRSAIGYIKLRYSRDFNLDGLSEQKNGAGCQPRE